MNIILQFNAEVERKLQEQAARYGVTVEVYLQRLAEQSVAVGLPAHTTAPEERRAAFRAWVASHKALPHEADDSRESIYAGRGE